MAKAQRNCNSESEEERKYHMDTRFCVKLKNKNLKNIKSLRDNFLFTGDSRGEVSIYNAESGSLLKVRIFKILFSEQNIIIIIKFSP